MCGKAPNERLEIDTKTKPKIGLRMKRGNNPKPVACSVSCASYPVQCFLHIFSEISMGHTLQQKEREFAIWVFAAMQISAQLCIAGESLPTKTQMLVNILAQFEKSAYVVHISQQYFKRGDATIAHRSRPPRRHDWSNTPERLAFPSRFASITHQQRASIQASSHKKDVRLPTTVVPSIVCGNEETVG